jgi:hypothetical protein
MTPNEAPPSENENREPIFNSENIKPKDTDMKPILNPEGVPVRKSHSYYQGMFDYNTNSFARKERFINRTYVGKSQVHGYGVFAKEDIKAGEIIEECQAVLLDTTFPNNKDWVLGRYCMTWNASSEIDQKYGPTMAMMLGHGMIYNHSEKPNAYVVQDTYMKVFTFYALSDIPKGTEISWYYGTGYAKRLKEEGNLTHSRGFPHGLANIPSGNANNLSAYEAPATENSLVKPNQQKKSGGCGCGNKKKEPAPPVPTEKVPFRSMVVPDKIINEENIEVNKTVTNDQVSESKV